MRSPEAENRHLQSSGRTVWVFAVLAVMIVVGLVVWMTSDPTNRMASSPDASTTGSASKSPPASSNTDPATQSSQR